MDRSIVIAGAGPVGMSLALALARAGVPSTLIERQNFDRKTAPASDGRATALSLSSKRLFDALEVSTRIHQHLSPINHIRVADGHPLRKPSRLFTHFDHKSIGDDPFGYIVENRFLNEALIAAIKQEKHIQIHENVTVESFEDAPSSVSIRLSEGKTIEAAVLIAADGKFSPLREQAGIKVLNVPYRQQALVCTVAHQQDHKGVAVELFMPSGPFAMLPMTERRSNIVWVEPPEQAEYLMELDKESFLTEIQQRFGGWLGDISLQGDRFSYPLTLMHARRYGAGRMILVGDAAHAIHPIAGQGLNLGFRDVAALAELIVEHYQLGLDIGHGMVLREYERWRRFDNQTMVMATDLLNRLFSNDIPLIRLIRDIGLGAVHRMPPLKRFLIGEAIGLSGKLPTLLQGKSL